MQGKEVGVRRLEKSEMASVCGGKGKASNLMYGLSAGFGAAALAVALPSPPLAAGLAGIGAVCALHGYVFKKLGA